MSELSKEEIEILRHTIKSPRCLFCGDSPEMQNLCNLELMESAGRLSFVPDEYFRITGKGRHAIKNPLTMTRGNDYE